MSTHGRLLRLRLRWTLDLAELRQGGDAVRVRWEPRRAGVVRLVEAVRE